MRSTRRVQVRLPGPLFAELAVRATLEKEAVEKLILRAVRADLQRDRRKRVRRGRAR